jgi:peptide/nickel transport system permease protein
MAVELREFSPASSGVPELKDPLQGRFALVWAKRDILVPAFMLSAIALMCFVYPEIYHLRSSTNGGLGDSLLPPFSPHYLLGTDPLGDDIVSRLLYGGRVSLEVGFGATAVGMVIGGAVGMASGYVGGAIDSIVMRALDILLAFPALILALVMSNYLGPSELHVIYAIAIVSVPVFARLSRAETIRLRDRIFIVAAKLSGSRDLRIVVRHLAPNVLQRLITYGFLFVAIAIIVEAALSFLGLGVPNPKPSWGNMIATGEQYLAMDPSLVLFPSACLFLTVVSLNSFGDALRSRLGQS